MSAETVDAVQLAVERLVADHGLPAVYAAVRAAGEFCGNCGTVKVGGERHAFMGMGWCSIGKAKP